MHARGGEQRRSCPRVVKVPCVERGGNIKRCACHVQRHRCAVNTPGRYRVTRRVQIRQRHLPKVRRDVFRDGASQGNQRGAHLAFPGRRIPESVPAGLIRSHRTRVRVEESTKRGARCYKAPPRARSKLPRQLRYFFGQTVKRTKITLEFFFSGDECLSKT